MDAVRSRITAALVALLTLSRLLLLDRICHSGHRPFALSGADTNMAVAPSQNILFTCDPKLITQLLRNPAFGANCLAGLAQLVWADYDRHRRARK